MKEDSAEMSAIASHVATVRRLFPERGDAVSELAMLNETFRSLCEDYGLATETLRLLETRNRPEDVEKMREYRQLLHELERELRSAFESWAH